MNAVFHVFTGSFYITACIMFNPADALTNIELAVKCKSYSLLNVTTDNSPVPNLSWRSTTTFINLIDYYLGLNRKSKDNRSNNLIWNRYCPSAISSIFLT